MEKAKFVDAVISKEIEELQKKQDHRKLALWAADCAEHVLQHFEEKHPDDRRPRMAIEAARAWVRGQIAMSEARTAAFASHGAARDAEDDAACAAARAAGHAAATAHVATHAVHAATYAAKSAAYTGSPEEADANTTKERNWQYKRLIDLGDNMFGIKCD